MNPDFVKNNPNIYNTLLQAKQKSKYDKKPTDQPDGD